MNHSSASIAQKCSYTSSCVIIATTASGAWVTAETERLYANYTNDQCRPERDVKGREYPLLMAAQEGHRAAVKPLIAAKADPNAKNKNGKTPMMMAREKGHTYIIDLIQNIIITDSYVIYINIR